MSSEIPDDLISLREAAAKLPCRPHISTLHRWRLRGVRETRLRTVMVGGQRFTTPTWLRDFIKQATEVADSGSDASPPMAPLGRDLAGVRADLDKLGIGQKPPRKKRSP